MVDKQSARKGRRSDKTGRSKHDSRFLKLEHYLLHSHAWKALRPNRRAIYIELAQRYNGSNNGEISMSVREAASNVHCSKDTASEAFHELEEIGFIKRKQCGSFDWKKRHATTWILTYLPFNNQPATKVFIYWKPENLKAGPNSRTNCADIRPQDVIINGIKHLTVLKSGQ